ncbi:MAG: TonB-dependent receptor family protein, partial [Bacteroidota bacterium]|nr:TonB-dependent receptor family protein [Bacteroidota bacterium]
MKISVRSFLPAWILLLVSTSAFTQDTTRPSVPQIPVDSTHPAIHHITRDTIIHPIPKDSVSQKPSSHSRDTSLTASAMDSVPATSKDSTHVTANSVSGDSTHTVTQDSTHRKPRSLSRVPGAQGFTGGRRNGGSRQSPAIGHFYGRIVDSKTNKGLDGTSVQLAISHMDTATHNRRDSVIRGAITPSNGNFSFEDLPIAGSYRLKITAIGYKPIDQRVTFNISDAQNTDPEQRMSAVDKDLGNIKLEIDPTSLQQVTVTAEKPLIQLGIDRKIYNVEKDLSAPGGTAVDIMKNIPSLAVDIDGNVTLRNASPTIFVDGRPTTLTLDQIPADEIESVEIITNPGAKFDASGGISGILNIIMKKNRKPGYNGAIRAGVDKRGGYNGGGNINIKEGKVNIFASGNLNHRKSISPGTTDRFTFISSPEFKLHQADSSVNNNHFVFGRLGLDYFLDNRNTLSVSGTFVHGTSKPYTNSTILQDTLYNNGYSNSSLTQRYSNTSSDFNNRSGMISYKHNFPRSGEEWTTDANYSYGKSGSVNKINSYVFNNPEGNLSNSYKQQQNINGDNEYITAQTDFTNPFTEKAKLETGARIAVRNISNLNSFNTVDSTGRLIYQPLLSSNYRYHDQVLAGYVQYSNTVGKLGFQFGLRAENSTYHGTNSFAKKDNSGAGGLKDTLGSFSNNYPVSLFPSIFLTEKLADGQDLQLNYTRRIDRPSFFQLTPFTDYSDSLNLSRGNPDLKPQFTNSVEMAYQINYQRNTFMASVYYKYTTDLIT